MEDTEDSTLKFPKDPRGYALSKLLGGGAFCIGVYKAEPKPRRRDSLRSRKPPERNKSDNSTQHSVAIKICSPFSKSFLIKEWECLTELDHPNIVKGFKGPSTCHSYSFMVLELIDGCDAYMMISDFFDEHKEGVPPRGAVAHIARSLLKALDYLSTEGYVYHDLKPENCLVGCSEFRRVAPSTVVKLCDFGMATKTGKPFVGSPMYCSPEQRYETIGHVTSLSDMFAFGLTFYALCTGLQPLDVQDDQLLFGPNFAQTEHSELVSELHQRVQSNESGFFFVYPAAKEVCLCTAQLEPTDRFTAKQVLELDFYAETEQTT